MIESFSSLEHYLNVLKNTWTCIRHTKERKCFLALIRNEYPKEIYVLALAYGEKDFIAKVSRYLPKGLLSETVVDNASTVDTG